MDPACPSRGFGIRRHRIKCLTAEHYSTFPIVLLGPVERNPENVHHRSSGPAAELNHTGTPPRRRRRARVSAVHPEENRFAFHLNGFGVSLGCGRSVHLTDVHRGTDRIGHRRLDRWRRGRPRQRDEGTDRRALQGRIDPPGRLWSVRTQAEKWRRKPRSGCAGQRGPAAFVDRIPLADRLRDTLSRTPSHRRLRPRGGLNEVSTRSRTVHRAVGSYFSRA